MTMQHLDVLYVGNECSPCRPPGMGSCKSRHVKRQLAKLQTWSTALHRKYRAAWAIRDGRLYLTAFDARAGERRDPVDLAWLFPFNRGDVLADWFTGIVEAEQGHVTRTGMYSRMWAQTVLYRVEHGVVVGEEVRDNSDVIARDGGKGEKLIAFVDSL